MIDKTGLAEAEAYIDTLSPEELADLEKELVKLDLINRAQVFSEEGFAAYFEFMHGTPLHREGEKWVANIFKAKEGTRKILQECFRGSGKTTVLSRLFVSYWIGHFPHTTNCIIRVNGKKANETTSAVARIIKDDYKFKMMFPHVEPVDGSWGVEAGFTVHRTDITPAEWDDICRENTRPDGPTLIGYGYDSGSVQGTRTSGLLIVDDIHVKENTRNPRQLEDVKNFVREQLLPIPVPNQGLEAWNFTPWLENDAYAERKGKGLYIYSRSPAMEETTADDPEGILWPEKIDWPEEILRQAEAGDIAFNKDQKFPKFEGKHWRLAWPERWGVTELALKYMDIGAITFAREYLLDLTALRGRVLKHEWLGWWNDDQVTHKEWESYPVVVGVDYASVSDKQKQGHRDYAAFAVGRAVPGGGVVLETGRFGHFTKPESLKYLQTLASQYPTLHTIKVEAIGKGEEFYNDAVLISDVNGKPLPLTKIDSHGRASKGERFEDYLAPRFETRRLWLKNYGDDYTDPFIEEFVEEWLTFPEGRYDDVIDAVYMMAVAGEGFMPSRAERSFSRKNRVNNPYAQLGTVNV